MKEEQEFTVVRYTPIFVGTTEDNEKVVLYRRIDKPHELHIRRPDGTLWAVGPGSFVFTQTGLDDKMRLEISSEPWTGKAIGTRRDLIDEPSMTIT